MTTVPYPGTNAICFSVSVLGESDILSSERLRVLLDLEYLSGMMLFFTGVGGVLIGEDESLNLGFLVNGMTSSLDDWWFRLTPGVIRSRASLSLTTDLVM